jgi:hypothetical protein
MVGRGVRWIQIRWRYSDTEKHPRRGSREAREIFSSHDRWPDAQPAGADHARQSGIIRSVRSGSFDKTG